MNIRTLGVSSEEIKAFLRQKGTDIEGIGDLENPEAVGINVELPFRVSRGISYGVHLSNAAVEMITSRSPGSLYAHNYRTGNANLDQIGMFLVQKIQQEGFMALAIPASYITSSEQLKGFIPHKSVALRAGLGWLGKNLLLINPNYGPRIRLGSVLTDAPFEVDSPDMKDRCGDCQLCIEACPIHALKGGKIEFPPYREKYLDTQNCYKRLLRFQKDSNIGVSICGCCVKACPYGKS